MDQLPRKLAAILYADVAGYSRLTGQDEEGTHRQLSTFLDILSESIETYGGTVVHYAGDAVLAEFPTVTDAVTSATMIQQELGARNRDLPDERKVQFRIGVNLGEIIVDRDDIYGDGVNVAARLESLAEPGGICISESVHTAVGNKLPLDYEFMGEQAVKNIAKPVKAYRVRLKSDTELPSPSKVQKRGKRTVPNVAAAAVVVLVVVVGVLGWLKPWEPREEPASIDRMAFPLPDKPSIAVLPFTNLSADPDQEYFADGMTDDLITDLSKLSGLFVIARNSSFAYKGKPVKVRQVAEDLGVRYVLEGSVRRADGQIRINVQLVDAMTGGHLWAERYDSSMNDVFAVQDKVTSNVVAALEVRLTNREQEARAQQETDSPEAYDAFLRGRAYYDFYSVDDFAKAIPYLEKSIRLDPNYARAHGVLASIYWKVGDNGWAQSMGMSYDDTLKKMERHLKEAMKNPTPLAHHIGSRFLFSQGRSDEALDEAKRAVALDLNDATGYVALGRVYNRIGKPAGGLEAIKKAMRLDPQGDIRGALSYRIGESYFHLDRFEESAAAFKKSTELGPDDEWSFLYLAAAYGHLGRKQEARSALEKFNNASAKKGRRFYTLAAMDGWTFPDETIRERYREGLRKAGVPPGAPSPPLEFRGVMKAPLEIEGATTIDATNAKALFDRGVPFVAVNSDPGWNRGHILGAVHLNLYHDFTEAKLTKVVAKDEEVVLYACGPGCGVSTRAVASAVSMGFKKVYFLREGFPGWKAAGYPIEVASK
jgi:TolB-like protein/class 3 adenylate cyclase/rhodanese-related sulfurtransferase